MIKLLVIGILTFVLMTTRYEMKIADLEEELQKEKLKHNYYAWCYQTACSEINKLRHQTPKQSTQQAKTTTDKDIVDAVKFAMKMSHPDNNGNTEDFLKFRKLYTELTK